MIPQYSSVRTGRWHIGMVVAQGKRTLIWDGIALQITDSHAIRTPGALIEQCTRRVSPRFSSSSSSNFGSYATYVLRTQNSQVAALFSFSLMSCLGSSARSTV